MNQILQAQKGIYNTYNGISQLTNTPSPSHVPLISFSEDEVLHKFKKIKKIYVFRIANVFAPTNRSPFEEWPPLEATALYIERNIANK